MQKFTRALTREIEVGSERLAVTLSEEGMSVRVVGSRKLPHSITWAACVYACTQGGQQPNAEELAACVKALRAGAKEQTAAAPASKPDAATTAEAPAHKPETAEKTPAHKPETVTGAEAKKDHAATDHHAGHAEDRLPTLLARLDAWLAHHRPRFAKGLLPGATPNELNALQGDLGHALPDELRMWLSWHNGQNPDVAGAFVQGWHLLGTQQIAEVKKDLDAEKTSNWHAAWIPFLDDDNDNYVCLDDRQPGFPVRECWRGKEEHATVADSLTAWVEQFVNDLEKGQYVEDSERGTLEKKT